jgi:hypothetical protein
MFDGFRKALAANRAQFFLDVPAGPFYGFNSYPGLPRGMMTTNADAINADLLAFIRS